MGWGNRLVIVKEKINPINYSDGSWSCAVLGLDNEEGAKFCQLVIGNYRTSIKNFAGSKYTVIQDCK